jgi:hypothetical protein
VGPGIGADRDFGQGFYMALKKIEKNCPNLSNIKKLILIQTVCNYNTAIMV